MGTYKIGSVVVAVSFLVQLVTSDDCLQPISTGNWTILMINPEIFCVKNCTDVLSYVNGYSREFYGICDDDSTCIVKKIIIKHSEESFPLLGDWLRQQTTYPLPIEFTKIEPTITIAVNFEMERATLFDNLLENGDYFKGYYMDEPKDIVFVWKNDHRNFLKFLEGNATRSTARNNPEEQYVTFEHKNSSFTLALRQQIDDGLWITDQPSLFLTNTDYRYESKDLNDIFKPPRFSVKVLRNKTYTFCEKQDKPLIEEKSPEEPRLREEFDFISFENSMSTSDTASTTTHAPLANDRNNSTGSKSVILIIGAFGVVAFVVLIVTVLYLWIKKRRDKRKNTAVTFTANAKQPAPNIHLGNLNQNSPLALDYKLQGRLLHSIEGLEYPQLFCKK